MPPSPLGLLSSAYSPCTTPQLARSCPSPSSLSSPPCPALSLFHNTHFRVHSHTLTPSLAHVHTHVYPPTFTHLTLPETHTHPPTYRNTQPPYIHMHSHTNTHTPFHTRTPAQHILTPPLHTYIHITPTHTSAHSPTYLHMLTLTPGLIFSCTCT